LQFKSREKASARHDIVMRLLVRRYVTAEQRKSEEFGITEDDVMEIRQDISSMKFEMIDIFKQNGYKTPKREHDSNVGKNTLFIYKNNSNLEIFNSWPKRVKIQVRMKVPTIKKISIGNLFVFHTNYCYIVSVRTSIKFVFMVISLVYNYKINFTHTHEIILCENLM